jgi:hypothetical protein
VQPRRAVVAEGGPASRDPWPAAGAEGGPASMDPLRAAAAEGGAAPTDPQRTAAAEGGTTSPPHRSAMHAGVSRLVYRRRRLPPVCAVGPPPLRPLVRAAPGPRPRLHPECTVLPSPPRRLKASIPWCSHRVRGGRQQWDASEAVVKRGKVFVLFLPNIQMQIC